MTTERKVVHIRPSSGDLPWESETRVNGKVKNRGGAVDLEHLILSAAAGEPGAIIVYNAAGEVVDVRIYEDSSVRRRIQDLERELRRFQGR